MTALHFGAFSGHDEVVAALLEARADPSAQDSYVRVSSNLANRQVRLVHGVCSCVAVALVAAALCGAEGPDQHGALVAGRQPRTGARPQQREPRAAALGRHQWSQ